MNEETLEKEIQDKRLNAPRLTPDDIDAVIVSAKYHHFENTTLTVCCLILQNGMTVTGESACVSMDNFDADLGRSIAYDDARRKVWALEGYLMRERISLSESGNPFPPIKDIWTPKDSDKNDEQEETSRRQHATITGDWRKLLDELYEIRLKEEEKRVVKNCGNTYIKLPPDIMKDIKRTLNLLEPCDVIVAVGGKNYKVIGFKEADSSVLVEEQ